MLPVPMPPTPMQPMVILLLGAAEAAPPKAEDAIGSGTPHGACRDRDLLNEPPTMECVFHDLSTWDYVKKPYNVMT